MRDVSIDARRTTCPAADDAGAAMVEASLAMPIFVLLVFAIIEMAGVLLSHSANANATSAGGRAASVAADTPLADQAILKRISAAASGIPNGEITSVVIYHAYPPNGPDASRNADLLATCRASASPSGPSPTSSGVPSGGIATDTYGACNAYSYPQTPVTGAFARAALPRSGADQSYGPGAADYYFGCSAANDLAPHGLDCNWPGSERNAIISSGADQGVVPDYVGVSIQTVHQHYTGFFGSAKLMSDHVIVHIEPQKYTDS